MSRAIKNRVKNVVKTGDATALENMLIEDLTGINERDFLGTTPLMYAVMGKHENCLRVLLRYGADQSIKNSTGNTAYDLASSDYKLLLNPETTTRLTMKQAIDNGDLAALRTLAAEENKINLPDYFGLTPLMYAAREGKTEAVRLLIKLGADQSLCDAAGHTAYDLASVELKQSQILKLDYSTRQGLVVAVREGNPEKLSEILEIDRSAINQKDSSGDTPLIQAIRAGHLASIQVLLHYGADETIRDANNMSPYDIATDDLRQFLNAENSTTVSVKKAILADDDTKLRSLLFHNAALLDKQDDDLGLTLLMFAVIKDREKCVQELIALGADESIRDSMGHTAYDRASAKIKKYLKSRHCTTGKAASGDVQDYYKDFDSIYAYPDMQTHVEIDHEKTKSHGSAQLLFGSFTDNHLKKTPVVVKLKRNGGHLAAESRIYGILKNSRFEKDMLTCFNGYGQGDPPYLVLEDFGSDLASAYRIEYRVRSTILVPQIVEAVNQLHQLGVVHADLKPENIIVSSDYRCKLCDFDSAGRVNESFPRTPQGDLKFSFSWVAPEVFKVYEEERKTRGRQHLSLCHEMDIFPLGLIIDLLSRRDLTCREMMTVLPNPTSDTADHSQLRKYLSSQQELNSLIYCLSHDHAYRHLVEPMISISTKHRLTMQHHSDSVKDYGLTGAYRKTKQQQSELEILKSFRENLNEFLDQHHTKTTESSALQWKYVESQIMSLLDSHEQSVQQMVEKVDTLTTQTMTTIQKTWKEALVTFSSSATNQDLADLMLTLQGRFDAMESMSIAPTCQGSLNASLITEMNLCLVNLAKSMEANNEKSYGKLCLLENELLAQKDQINEIKNNLHESHMEQMRNSDNIMLKLETLGMVLNNSFQDFHETIDSIKTNDEMKVFCSSLKLEIESKVMELFDGLEKTLDEKSRRSESRLESIQAEMVKLAEISQKGVEKNEANSEGLKKRQEELHVVLKTIDERLQKDKEEFETKLLNLQGAIIDSIVEKLENSQDSLATQLDSGVKETMEHVLEKRLGEILSNVKSLGDDLKLSDEELSKLISETKEKVQAVRNFQDLSAFNAHNHPLLFILSEERVRGGAINSMMDAVSQIVRQGYRVHFLCTVCGKMAPSGKHGGKERTKYFWDRVKNSMSHIELDQGGYRLMITHRWVEDFLTGMKWVLRALQFAGRLSGLPLPHLTEFLDFLPIPDSFREMSDKVLDEVRDITRSLCDLTDEDRDRDGREILRDNDTLGDDSDSDDGNGNNNGADPVDKAEVKRLKRSARKDSQSNYHKLITAEDMRRNWDKHRPKVSLTDVKLVKQLLEFVGDHDVEHTGLRRSLRALDGTCAWVCDNNDRSLMCGADPTDTRSCYELYQAEGSKCCLIDLNYV